MLKLPSPNPVPIPIVKIKVNTLFANELAMMHTPARIAPAIVTIRHPNLLTNADDIGPRIEYIDQDALMRSLRFKNQFYLNTMLFRQVGTLSMPYILYPHQNNSEIPCKICRKNMLNHQLQIKHQKFIIFLNLQKKKMYSNNIL